MHQNKSLFNNKQINYDNSRVAVVTTDRTQWAKKSKYRWIFWLAVLLSAAVLFGSCKSKNASEGQVDPSDTAGLAAFNAQKAADSLAALENGQTPGTEGAANDNGQGQSFTSNDRQDGQSASDNDNNGAVKSVNDEANSGDYADDNSGGATAGTQDAGQDQTDAASSETTATTKKKKFSSAAKGAVIGAGSGAVLGAIVSKKNRGLGAVIGAAVGGGAGYGIGKHKDNKKAKEGQ